MTSGYVCGLNMKQKWSMFKTGLHVQESFLIHMQILRNSKQFCPQTLLNKGQSSRAIFFQRYLGMGWGDS